MAESICPFCGKTNSSDAEFCWSCRARLVPAVQGNQPGENASPEELAEWLKQTGGQKTSPAEQKPRPEEVPEWLARVRERSQLEKEAIANASKLIPEEPQEAESDVPDWLKEIGAESKKVEQPAAQEESTPPSKGTNILSSSDLAPETQPEPEPIQPSAQKSQDWLNQDENIPDVFPSPSSSSEETSPEPDSLRTNAVPHPEPEKASSAELSAPTPESAEVHQAFSSAKPFHTDDLRQIFMTADETPPEEENPEQEESKTTSKEGLQLPDWLKELETAVPPEPPGTVQPESEQEPEKKPALFPEDATKNEPDSQQIAASPSPFSGRNIPAWLENVTPTGGFNTEQPAEPSQGIKPPAEPPDKVAAPFEVENLPDWLEHGEERRPISPTPSTLEKESSSEVPLEPATLPPWLKSMRPLESAMPENLPVIPQGEEDSHGPLAGISDTLPGSTPSKNYSKPPAYTGGLRITDRQRIHAQVLESVLKSSASLNPEAKTARKDRSKVWRIVISLLMIVVLFGKILFSNLQLVPLPQVYSNGVIATRDFLISLPENSLVLLVADFEPSLSGELGMASQALLEQLMVKQTRIAVVSTQPSGAILAQNMLTNAQAKSPSYSLDGKVVNLGYLAGGAIGLQNFSRTPSFSFQNTAALSSPVLNNGLDWKNFSAIIILTDSIENGRLWVEQVLPSTPSIPAFMVASSQAAPILSPYIDSRQIKGLIAGIEGGAVLSQQLNLPGSAQAFWDPFQIGILLLIVFIILGGIIQAIAARSVYTKEKKEETTNAVH
jgi:hypothetical protein